MLSPCKFHILFTSLHTVTRYDLQLQLAVHQRAVEGAFDMQTAQLGCRHTALTQIGSRRCRPTARGRFRVQAAVLTIPREYSKVRQPSWKGAFLVMRMTIVLARWPVFGYKT